MDLTSIILIVDDDAAGRRALEALLLGEGYQLLFAHDGLEALELAARHRPDVTLLDVMMPNMDGYEVCRRLRADPLLAEAPIIMVTALDDRQSRLRGLEAGADDFITKPFDRQELRARVRTIVRLNRYRSLYAERAQFRWLIDTAQAGYALLDADGRLTYCNQPAAGYLDVDPARLPETSFLELVQRQYRCEPAAAWRNWPVPAANDTPRFLVRPASNHSLAFWLSVETRIPPGGTVAAHVVRLRDVTQQVSEQRDLTSFRMAVQHKLRTPIAHMSMGATLLSVQQAPSDLPPALADYVEIVQKAAANLSRQIDDLVQYASLTPAMEFNADATVGDLLQRAGRIAHELGIEQVTCDADADLHAVRLPLPARAVEIILVEMLENAYKFHPTHQPHVTIKALAENIQQGHTQPGDSQGGDGQGGDSQHIVFHIEDDGVSLSPDQLERAWQPYYQAEKGFSGNMPGMGLGLPIVASLVWNVGGRYRLYNRQPGPGIVAEVVLPSRSAALKTDPDALGNTVVAD